MKKSYSVQELNKDLPTTQIIINQHQGLGDILFLMPLVQQWYEQGYAILWPIIKRYLNIQKHFPNINFVNNKEVSIPLNRMIFNKFGNSIIVPFLYASEIMRSKGEDYRHVMGSKYALVEASLDTWKTLKWERDYAAERKLFYDILNLTDDKEFTLISTRFRSDRSGRRVINGFKTKDVIEVDNLEGFTLLDWGMVIQKASYIHTVHTSINYIMEILPLTAKELHMYRRVPDEKGFSNFDYLFSKPYIYHL